MKIVVFFSQHEKNHVTQFLTAKNLEDMQSTLGYNKPLFGPDDAGGSCPNPSYLWNAQCCCGANCCWDECDLFYFSWWNYSLSTTDCLKGVPDSKWIFNSNLGYYQAFQFTTE